MLSMLSDIYTLSLLNLTLKLSNFHNFLYRNVNGCEEIFYFTHLLVDGFQE
jgi:hypothetical protein